MIVPISVPLETVIENNVRSIVEKHKSDEHLNVAVMKTELARYLRSLFAENILSEYDCQLSVKVPYVMFTLQSAPQVSYRIILNLPIKTT